ncbi:DUF86 domain-containing protein [Leptospira santarosai]|uniref:PF01934 family protein n=2 Tax=Leptospira santarosai TaxID=28183 RepID=A0A0E2BDY5_9LEPT|nr:HepT-like ribonuclease domain-containing protein [Leptospira santarosai]EKO33145.1 PF01934 family protein [Leptospira santarosai str. MOR084]EMN19648.1 PF01934 family protein [Leptospira santarosai serovar Arenal str. MAVJ 401]EMO21817.1 PF01934 family protein [Leptospira santarosai str. HAI134]EMO32180.1 PF01934 family protein [Leptospira santarosai str. HAI821]MDI7226575.1 DUF86 domain-containing protein [Leptospira santarosai]
MKSDLGYINHIKEELTFLQIESKKLNRDQFISDNLIKRAFVRSIEIIGEASNKLSDSFKRKYSEVDWRKLSATRNRLIHGYFVVDYDIVWDLVINKIPTLETQINSILLKEKTLFD